MGYRISADIGGTFTDFTVAEGDLLVERYKSPTTPKDLTQGVFACLRLAAADLGMDLEALLRQTEVFTHGSTIATNAILERKGVKCGVLCTRGTRYTLWKGEGRRKDIFHFKVSSPPPLVRPYLCLEVSERINSEGEILVPLREEEVRAAIRQLRAWDVQSIAVCLLWSVVNPVHERRIGEIIEEEWPGVFYSLSSEIQPILREYPRMSCVALNSMLQPIVSDYFQRLQRALAESRFGGELLIVISGGGATSIPVARLAQELGIQRVIIPQETAVLCAFGALNADIALSHVVSKYADTRRFDYLGVNQVLERLEARGKAFLDRLGTPPDQRQGESYGAARYPLQVTELEIPLRAPRIRPEGLSTLVQDFHEAHRARYKTADPESPVEFVMWRHVAKYLTSKINLPKQLYGGTDPSGALQGTQPAYFEEAEGFLETPYYDGDRLAYGMRIEGPAIIVLPDTTIVVPPGFRISTQARGYYILEAPCGSR